MRKSTVVLWDTALDSASKYSFQTDAGDKENVSKNTKAACHSSFLSDRGKGKKCSIMSNKVFFLRFKDHCATLNMFVTFPDYNYLKLHKNFISLVKEVHTHLSQPGSHQSQQINYSVHLIQIDFLTEITMLSSRSGHVSLTRWCE